MDLPLENSTGSYQIHRTPYFRRVHRKDSDEFKRLKQAYENVLNFNEKPLQAQIKKIRLGKLLSRIKTSLTSQKLNKTALKGRPKPKTKEQIRREELAKARQLGIEYCRQNFQVPVSSFSLEVKQSTEEDRQNPKLRLERRLDYGNTKSRSNRYKSRNSDVLNSQRSVESDISTFRSIPQQKMKSEVIPRQAGTSGVMNKLKSLQKSQPKEEFIKFLVHCLSTDKPRVELIMTFKEILKSRNDLYWDLVEAVQKRQHTLNCYGRLMKMFSKLACRTERREEAFHSKTYLRPSCPNLQEVHIKTHRYWDECENLPLPTESLLRLSDNAVEVADKTIDEPMFSAEDICKQNSSHLFERLANTLRTDRAKKTNFPETFEDIIRNTVRKESAVLLSNLEKAIKH